MALLTEQVTGNAEARSWTSAQASVGRASFDGVRGMTIAVNSLGLSLNNEAVDGSVVDYSLTASTTDAATARNTDLSVATGPDSELALTLKGSDGDMMQLTGALEIDLFGFIQVSGSFGITSADAEMTLADGRVVEGRALSLGVSDGRAFVGVGGSDADRLGFELLGLDLGLVMFDSPSVADSSWTALSASADSIGFVGIDGFTLMAQGITLEMNSVEGTLGTARGVMALNNYEVVSGAGLVQTVSTNATRGEVLGLKIDRATLAISDYIYISGGFYFEQAESVLIDVGTGLSAKQVNDDPTLKAGLSKVTGVSADYSRIENLEAGSTLLAATDVDIFVGMGPYFIDTNNNGLFDSDEHVNEDRWGITLDNIDLGLVFMNPTDAADPDGVIPNLYALQVNWDAQIDIDWVLFQFQLESMQVYANQGGEWGELDGVRPFIDFKSSFEGGVLTLEVSDKRFDFDYDRRLIGVRLDDALLGIGGFFFIEGTFVFEKSDNLSLDVQTQLPSRLTGEAASLNNDLRQLKRSGYLSADNSRFEGLPVDAIVFGASDVSIKIGSYDDPLINLDGIDVAFATFRATEAVDPNSIIPRMYSMSAFWPVKLDVDWGFMKLAIDDITLKLNTGSDWEGLKVGPYADLRSSFGAQGLKVNTGDAPIYLNYSSDFFGVEVSRASVSLGDFFYIQSGFAITRSSGTSVDVVTGFADGSYQGAAALGRLNDKGYFEPGQYSRLENVPMKATTIGFSDAMLFVGSGPYFVDSNGDGRVTVDDTPSEDAIGFAVDNLDLAVVLYSDPEKIVPDLWALSATVDFVGLVGIDFLKIEGEMVRISANQGDDWENNEGVSPYVDFKSTYGAAGLSVLTGGVPIDIDYDTPLIGVYVGLVSGLLTHAVP